MDINLGLGAAAFFIAVAWFSVRKLEHSVDPIERLRMLAELKESGLLEDKEFERLRKRQLYRLRWHD